jgi:LAO/AO transport system kinase
VLTVSAQTGEGLADLWARIEDHASRMTAAGARAARRAEQQVTWMRAMLDERLTARLRSDPAIREALAVLEKEVAAGRLAARAAVETIAEKLGV